MLLVKNLNGLFFYSRVLNETVKESGNEVKQNKLRNKKNEIKSFFLATLTL